MRESRPRLVRHRSDAAAFDLVRGVPDPRLALFVLRYAGFREEVPSYDGHLEPPTPKTVLIVNFGAPFEIDYPDDGAGWGRGWQRYDSFLAGFGTRRAANRGTGRSHCMQVDFTPLGGRLFLGLPMDDVSDRCAGLDALFGPSAEALRGRLAEAPDWPSRFALFDRLLLARAAAAEGLLGSRSWHLANWLQARLVGSGGQIRIATLADAAGVSHRHLTAVSRAELGVTPKAYARVLRFNRAQQLIQAAGDPDWAALALETGYFDQAHLIREFRSLAGQTPGHYRRSAEG